MYIDQSKGFSPALEPSLPGEVLYEGDSLSGRLFVISVAGVRMLRFGSELGADQSIFDPQNPLHVPMPYIQMLSASILYPLKLQSVLILGLGGGSLVSLFQRALPETSIDVVEWDPAVLEVAENYFAFEKAPKTRVFIKDAVAFTANLQASYDLIILDLYDDKGIPFPFGTLRFLKCLRKGLRSGGVVAINLAADSQEEKKIIQSSRSIFGPLHVFETEDECNLILITLPNPRNSKDLYKLAKGWDQQSHFHFSLQRLLSKGLQVSLSNLK